MKRENNMITAEKYLHTEEKLVLIPANKMSDYLSGKRVLLAGANEVDEMLLRYMVVDGGGTLNIATSTEALIKALHKSRYDLIFMNARLGNDNAMTVLKNLRAEGILKSPVIGISSTNLAGRGLYSGFSHVLGRPLEKKNVIEALSEIFEAE
jgi:CheY-like chemotaxis protein